jgi:hypothetical protein
MGVARFTFVDEHVSVPQPSGVIGFTSCFFQGLSSRRALRSCPSDRGLKRRKGEPMADENSLIQCECGRQLQAPAASRGSSKESESG